MKLVTTAVAVAGVSCLTHGQNLLWENLYDGETKFDESAKVVVDKRGRTVVAISATFASGGNDNFDVVVRRYNVDGSFATRRLETIGINEKSVAVATDNDGNIFVTAQQVGSPSESRIAVHKLRDSDLFPQWDYVLSSITHDTPTDIGLDSQNNVYVCGTRISERDQFGNPTVSQMIAIRLDPLTGQLATGWPYIWPQTADGLNGANALVVDKFDAIYLAGFGAYQGNGQDPRTRMDFQINKLGGGGRYRVDPAFLNRRRSGG